MFLEFDYEYKKSNGYQIEPKRLIFVTRIWVWIQMYLEIIEPLQINDKKTNKHKVINQSYKNPVSQKNSQQPNRGWKGIRAIWKSKSSKHWRGKPIPFTVGSSSSRSRTVTGIEIMLVEVFRFLQKEKEEMNSNFKQIDFHWNKKLSDLLTYLHDSHRKTREETQSICIYLLEPDAGLLRWRTDRFFCWNSLSGVSSTTRLAIRSASSSQPARAAADLNLGLRKLSASFPIPSGFDSIARRSGSEALAVDPSCTIFRSNRWRRSSTREAAVFFVELLGRIWRKGLVQNDELSNGRIFFRIWMRLGSCFKLFFSFATATFRAD